MNSYLTIYLMAWKQYAVLTGRSTRSDYWAFALVTFIISLALLCAGLIALLYAVVQNLPLSTIGRYASFFQWVADIYCISALVPSYAIAVRRLHDINHSGWWLLLGLIPIAGWIVIFVWFCTKGTRGSNRFGPDPLGGDDDVSKTPGAGTI